MFEDLTIDDLTPLLRLADAEASHASSAWSHDEQAAIVHARIAAAALACFLRRCTPEEIEKDEA